MTIKGFDVTNQIKAPQIELLGNRLLIAPPEQNEIKINTVWLVKEFTISQFSKSQNEEKLTENNEETALGSTVLSLHIPRDVDIIDSAGLNIKYVVK